jgi:hypothetical protein
LVFYITAFIVINHNKKINGIYAVTPNHALNIDAIEKIIIQYNITLLQYRHKAVDAQTQLKLTSDKPRVVTPNKNINYSEKIDNFILQDFDEEHRISHLIEAKRYFNIFLPLSLSPFYQNKSLLGD